MDPLWLLEGEFEAPGWKDLEADSRADEVDLIAFDRAGWALVQAAEPPTKYEGLKPTRPETGLYVSEQGVPIYVVDGAEVSGPLEVIRAIGGIAEQKLAECGDPIVVLQDLGKAF